MKLELKVREPNHYTVAVNEETEIKVVDFIPYIEKEQMAFEIASAVLQMDEDLGVCYSTYVKDVVETYYYVKYYTNVDVEDVTPTEVHDWLMSNHIYGKVIDYGRSDFWTVEEIVDKLIDVFVLRFEKEHSLEQQVKDLLKTDPNVNNDETRELLEKLVDMKGALLEKENNVIPLNTKKAANPKTGGVKINLSKKDKM